MKFFFGALFFIFNLVEILLMFFMKLNEFKDFQVYILVVKYWHLQY